MLSFSEVVTCPEVVTNSMTCDELKLYIGKTFDSTAGSPVKIGSEGAAGLSQFKCTEGAAIVYYLFFITFTDDATASTDTDIMASVASINAIIAEPTASNEVADSENLKPAVFQKFEAVDENTMTYVVQTSLTESYKIFKSDATTVTLTKKDFEAAFGDKVIADPDAAKACGDAVQLVFKEQSGSSSISAATMLLFAPFMLSMFK